MHAYNHTKSVNTHNERPFDVLMKPSVAWKAYTHLYLRKKTSQVGNKNQKDSRDSPLLPSPGDYVRILRLRHPFEKESGDFGTFSREIYQVSRVNKTMKEPMIHLTDLRGSKIKGGFYISEIQIVTYSPDNLFEVSKILGNKTIRGEKFVKVQWKGYVKPDWIKASLVQEVPKDSLVSEIH